MRTSFSKRFVASGLIAAIGANLLATGPAFAGSDRDRSFKREDSRRGEHRGDRHRSRGNDRGDRSSFRSDDGDRRHARGDSHEHRGHGHDRRPAVRVVEKPIHVHRHIHRKPAVRIVETPVVVHREIHRKPVVKVVERPVVFHHGPVIKTDNHRHHVHYGAPTRVIVVPERRRYRDIWVVRRHGHRYHGYGHYHQDHDAYQWLAFTAISVALIGALSEAQQRSYEDAQIRATTAPIGETIHWSDAGAAGAVTAVREGTSSQNRYCREFQQTVTVGGKTEQAYGTACRQPDGAWEIVAQPSF